MPAVSEEFFESSRRCGAMQLLFTYLRVAKSVNWIDEAIFSRFTTHFIDAAGAGFIAYCHRIKRYVGHQLP